MSGILNESTNTRAAIYTCCDDKWTVYTKMQCLPLIRNRQPLPVALLYVIIIGDTRGNKFAKIFQRVHP